MDSRMSAGNIAVPCLNWSQEEVVPSYTGDANCFAIQLFVIDAKNEMRSIDFLPKGLRERVPRCVLVCLMRKEFARDILFLLSTHIDIAYLLLQSNCFIN